MKLLYLHFCNLRKLKKNNRRVAKITKQKIMIIMCSTKKIVRNTKAKHSVRSRFFYQKKEIIVIFFKINIFRYTVYKKV